MNSHPELFKWLEQRKQGLHHRQLLIISGEEQWGIQIAKSIIQVHEKNFNSSALAIGIPGLEGNIKTNQYRQYLGHEFSTFIYNTWQGIRANALCALAGTVQKGGVMVLLCPPLKSWPRHRDPELSQRISFGYIENFDESHFIKWLIHHIHNDQNVCLISENGVSKNAVSLPLPIPTPEDQPQMLNYLSKHEADGTEDIRVSTCQHSAISNIMAVAHGHRGRPLVIQADRGRGKSSALGIAAAQISKGCEKPIVITAPKRAQCEQAFAFYKRCGGIDDNLIFMAIDSLLENPIEAAIIIVDEAAAIPADLLVKLCKQYKRLVFSTTIHGYEGSGRGFEIRFKPQLTTLFPHTKVQQLSTPLRWFHRDPLEQIGFSLFCQSTLADVVNKNTRHTQKRAEADNSLFDSSGENRCKASSVTCFNAPFNPKDYVGEVNSQTLIDEPALLTQIFSLLVEAHYQTTPDTLASMLESPDQITFVSIKSGKLESAAIVAKEGSYLLSSLSEAISHGLRRPSGHLLAQKSAYLMGNPALAVKRYIRVVRIAVRQNSRRKSIGSELLAEICRWSTAHEFDFIGASFGLDNKTLAFWLKNEFHLVDIGLRKETTTGEHNAIVMKCITDDNSKKTAQNNADLALMNQRCRSEFPFQLPKRFCTLSTELVYSILKHFPESNIDERVMKELELFSDGHRSLDATLLSLNIAAQNIGHIHTLDLLDEHEISLLLKFSLQDVSIKELQGLTLITGKKSLEKQLRTTTRKLISLLSKITS